MAGVNVCSQSLLQDWYNQSSEPRGCSAVSIFHVYRHGLLRDFSIDLQKQEVCKIVCPLVVSTSRLGCIRSSSWGFAKSVCASRANTWLIAITWHYLLLSCRYEKDVHLFKSKVVGSVKLCSSHLFDQPKIEDPYAIMWVLWANSPYPNVLRASFGVVADGSLSLSG